MCQHGISSAVWLVQKLKEYGINNSFKQFFRLLQYLPQYFHIPPHKHILSILPRSIQYTSIDRKY